MAVEDSDYDEEDSDLDSDSDPEIIVIDNGSYSLQAGFSRDDAPRAVFPPLVGRPKFTLMMPGPGCKDYYIGDEVISKRGILKYKNPIEKGVIVNFDDMEKLWHHTFYNELRVCPDDCKGVILSHSPLADKASKEKSAQIMFETFGVKRFYTAISEELALSSAGRTSGLVLSSGNELTYAVPIHEGRAVRNAIQRSEFGGSHLTAYLIRLMLDRGYDFATPSEKGIARDIKEKYTSVAENLKLYLKFYDSPQLSYTDLVLNNLLQFWGEELIDVCKIVSNYLPTNLIQHKMQIYELPSGSIICLEKEQFECPEFLFGSQRESFAFNEANCHLDGHPGIHNLIQDAISLCNDTELEDIMYKNIILAGGNTMFPGIESRLEMELQRLASKKPYKNFTVNVVADPERKYATWIGGARRASALEYGIEGMWITKDQWDETGPSVVDRLNLDPVSFGY